MNRGAGAPTRGGSGAAGDEDARSHAPREVELEGPGTRGPGPAAQPARPAGRPRDGEAAGGEGSNPDRIVTSPALRAATTATVIAEAVGYPGREIVEDERLYGAGSEEILEVIRGVEDRFDRVFLLGHNPGLTDLVNELSHEPIRNVPTCGVVEFRIAGESWSDVRRDTAMRVDFDYPKRRG